MARSTGALYKGSLKLDRVVGVRPDKGQRMTPIKSLAKPNTDLPQPPKSMMNVLNVTSDGLKKQ